MFQCLECERPIKTLGGLKQHLNKCKGKVLCRNCQGLIFRAGLEYCSRNCYKDYLKNNPEYCKEITRNANIKTRELGSVGLHWCQQNNEKAKLQHEKWYTKGHEKTRELVANGEFWSQWDKEKLAIAMEKIHTDEAHNKLSQSLTGREFSPEHRQNISRVRIEKGLWKGKNNPMYGKTPKTSKGFKGGIRKDLLHYVCSTWEANFARILKYQNIDYDFEFETFEIVDANGNEITYTPDFKVGDRYIEVKGFWYDDGRLKFELFKQQYPHIEIELVDKDRYLQLTKQYKNIIKEWE